MCLPTPTRTPPAPSLPSHNLPHSLVLPCASILHPLAQSHDAAVQTLRLRTPRPNDVETRADAYESFREVQNARVKTGNGVPTERMVDMADTRSHSLHSPPVFSNDFGPSAPSTPPQLRPPAMIYGEEVGLNRSNDSLTITLILSLSASRLHSASRNHQKHSPSATTLLVHNHPPHSYPRSTPAPPAGLILPSLTTATANKTSRHSTLVNSVTFSVKKAGIEAQENLERLRGELETKVRDGVTQTPLSSHYNTQSR
jgi:hypothetical protein